MKRAAFTLHDLKQHLQLSHNTIYKAIDPLIAYNLVEEAETLKLRKKGRQTTLYKLPWATDGQVEAARRLYHDSKVGGVTLSLEEHIRRQGYEAIVEDILMAHRDTFGDRSEEAPVEKKIFNRIVENSEHGDYRDREEIRRILWKEHGVTCIR